MFKSTRWRLNSREQPSFSIWFRSANPRNLLLQVFKPPSLLSYLGLSDKVKRFYFQTLRKRDFSYMETGLIRNKEHEYLIAGKLELDAKNQRLVIRRPDLVIASDRLDYYDFLGRRREHFGLQNRNWLKFCVAITAAHFLLVRVPTLFSLYFGDDVGMISKKMGASDESETKARLQRMKEQNQA